MLPDGGGLVMHRLIKDQRIRFLIVGGYNTAFGYLSFALAYWLFGEYVHYVILATATHFLAVTNSFLTQRHLVFRSYGSWKQEFVRFQIAYLAMLPVGIGLLAIFFDLLGLPMLVAQAGAMLTVVFVSYFVSSRYTFLHKGQSEK
jgi:putative flippase GtrA